MNDVKDATFSFGDRVKVDEWDLDEEIANEGWKVKDVQEITKINENMNNLRVSKRVVPKRPAEKWSALNVRRWLFADIEVEKLEEDKLLDNQVIVASSSKKTLKEEIHELLMCWVNERKKNLLNPVKDSRCKYKDYSRKSKSQSANYSKEDSIAIKQLSQFEEKIKNE